MAKFVARLVVALGVLYVLGAVAFAFLHYGNDRPAIPAILSDFNAWLGSLIETKRGPPKPAETTLPPDSTETPGYAPGEPAPGSTPPAAPGGPPVAGSAQDRELSRIQHEVLPRASEKARALRDMSRADNAAFENARSDVLAMLSEARTFLGGILDKEPHHPQANRLWGTLQELYTAVKKL